MSASPTSLMPEGQMKTLSDQQIRDLFAYLMSKTAP
jgi:mono/diheme cytochrome c family protein